MQTWKFNRNCLYSFRTSLQIGDRFFQPVAAGSKKDSKLKAAEAALAVLQQSGKLVTSATAEVLNGVVLSSALEL